MNIVIEIPSGSKEKIEIEHGIPVVNRVLSIGCPYNYGYIEGTLCPDGDPLDVFVLGNPLPTLTKIQDYKILGLFECLDNGVRDDKAVAYQGTYPYDVNYMLLEIDHYLRNYKEGFQVLGWNLNPNELILDYRNKA